MEIEYERMKAPNLVKRTIEPVGILFSEYYFYLAAFLRNIDREKEFTNKMCIRDRASVALPFAYEPKR